MGTDTHFLAAGERHLSDGTFLHEDSREANADQLYGIAAECAIKAVLLALVGIQVHNDAPVHP